MRRLSKNIYILLLAAVGYLLFAASGKAYVPTPFIYVVEAGQAGMLVCGTDSVPQPTIGADNSVTLNCLTLASAETVGEPPSASKIAPKLAAQEYETYFIQYPMGLNAICAEDGSLEIDHYADSEALIFCTVPVGAGAGPPAPAGAGRIGRR